MARPAYGDGPGASPAFLADGGVMGALIRAHDWAATPLGPPEGWPQGLKTALRLALTTRHPMFIFWGPEHICLYNDGYRPSLGPEKHPSILGAPGRPAWAEIWEIIGPQIELVMRGEGATWHENQLVPIVRHGGLQDVYWTYTFGPIDDATAPSGIGGVLVVCTETTQQVLAERRAKTERERLAAMFQQAPGFICTLRGPDHVFEFVNDEHRRLFNSAGWVGKPVREAFPDIAGQGFYELLDQVYATGERVVMHGAPVRFRLTPEAAEQELLIDFIYAPMRDETGSITGIYCSGNDVTEQKRRELNAAILDLVGKDLALLATPDEIMQAVGARVGGFLRLSGCIFADVDEERGDVAVHHAWTAGNVPSLLRQTFRLDDYLSEEFGRAGRAGETFVVRDTAGDERTHAGRYASLRIGGFVVVPFHWGGRWTRYVAATSVEPRDWRADEIELLEGISDRIFSRLEHARADEAVRESETRYRTLFEAIEVGFCIIEVLFDAEGTPNDYRFLEINPAFARQTGLSDALGRRVRELVPTHEQHWFDVYGQVALTGEPAWLENGSATLGRWWYVHAFRVGEPEQRRVAVLFNDITPRRKAELALRELNETLERRIAEALAERKVLADIVEATDAQVQVLDLDYRWLAINTACADEYERIYAQRPTVGASLLELLADRPEQREAARAVWARALAGEAFTAVGEFGDPTLGQRTYEMRFEVLRDPQGGQIGAFLTGRDISDRIREQRRLAEAEAALHQAQKMEAIGQLTGGVAHDFNNLLTVVAGGLRLLDRPLDPERRQRVVDGMRHAVERGAGLTRQLLAFGRRQALNPEPVDLSQRVRALHDMLARSLRDDIRLELALAEQVWPVEVDPGELELALLNLCVNARDAMPEGGLITVSVENAAPGTNLVRLAVRDSGVGMAPDVVARAQEPFFTTKEVGKGSGLGLSQVYGFARQSGGEVEIASAVGQGTTVTLTLPRSARQPELEPGEAAGRPAAEGAAAHVLLVEDDEEVAALTRAMLDSLGFAVTHVASASGAMDALAGGAAFDIVFSDVMLPGGTSGLELARQLRQRRPELPVVLATGLVLAAAGARDEGFPLLLKPYRLEALSATLRVQLRARA